MSDLVGADIAEKAPDALAGKAETPWARMAVLGLVAGAFIAFGTIAFLIVQAVPGGPSGPVQLLSGLAFSIGLVLVMVAGAELFTGNTMFVLPARTGRLAPGRLAGAWTLVWTANLVGSVAIALLFAASGGLDALEGEIARAAVRVTEDKFAKTGVELFASAILANMLVCLAVWMSMTARTIPAKVLAIVGPVMLFVAAGFEHSIANMSILPIGLLAGAGGMAGDVALNLAVSTAGNILGGGAVALLLAYGHAQDG